MNFLHKNLRYLRKKGNHNQEDISLLFHKRANTIGNWENQKSEPSLMELMKLAEYFKVSTETLLQVDLERESYTPAAQPQGPVPSEHYVKPYTDQEPVTSVAKEANPDAFWLILRELRAVNEKVDILIARAAVTPGSLNSDKSSH
jgi:transcriptional regulator with XRE-family HTH domain